jgi:hypothetical protein
MQRIDLNPEIIVSIISDYEEGLRGNAIADKYDMSPGKIYKTIRTAGAKVRPTSRRKYFIDEKMFEKVNCEWKAYLLGLIYSDGCVRRLNVTLGLHEKDKAIMENLTKILGCPLKYSPPKTYVSKGRTTNNHGRYFFNLNSIRLVEDIIKLGCGPKKSLTLKFPTYEIIPRHLFHHFIRGYFDGDGCIQSYTFHIISSDDFCIGFQKWLMIELNISSYLKKHQKISRVKVHRLSDIKKLRDYMYSDATLYLLRKRNKFRD